MSRDLHQKPFDSGTKVKLSIFHDYLKEWLPVFLAKKEIYWNDINIYDFFCGPGLDNKGIKGTPILILEELEVYKRHIPNKNLKVNLYFNDYSSEKTDKLKSNIEQYKDRSYNIRITSKDFKEAFSSEYPRMRGNNKVNLLFLDQTGIKQINEKVFKSIIELKRTDFLFFISSSTIKRFTEQPSISRYIKLNPKEVEKTPYHQIHRLVTEYYRSLIPSHKEYYIAPFSLKKKAGLYGLIFGSSNPLGIEKFLTTCWRIDPVRGEANFDIDNDKIQPGQIDMFTGSVQKPKKIEAFEKELSEEIIKGKLRTDKDVYLYTLNNGFIPKHSKKVIRKLIKDRKIKPITLNLKYGVCKRNATLNKIELIQSWHNQVSNGLR